MVGEIRVLRDSDDPYDVVIIGNVNATLPEPTTLAAYEDAGVTWTLTQALSLATARERIRRGPARSTAF